LTLSKCGGWIPYPLHVPPSATNQTGARHKTLVAKLDTAYFLAASGITLGDSLTNMKQQSWKIQPLKENFTIDQAI